MSANLALWEPASLAGPALSATVCSECGDPAKRLTKQRCRTCYSRLLRGGGKAREIPPLDPEIAGLLLPVPGTSETFAARFFSWVDFTGDCWEWTGAKNKGYGVIGRGGRGTGIEQAHRAMWTMLVGPIPDGLQIDHHCRNHICVNPDHLEPVTAAVNKERGFSPPRLHALRDTCSQGHPKDGRLGARGGKRTTRYCKTCARQKASAYHARKRAA